MPKNEEEPFMAGTMASRRRPVKCRAHRLVNNGAIARPGRINDF
jgi:hypothetical protein